MCTCVSVCLRERESFDEINISISFQRLVCPLLQRRRIIFILCLLENWAFYLLYPYPKLNTLYTVHRLRVMHSLVHSHQIESNLISLSRTVFNKVLIHIHILIRTRIPSACHLSHHWCVPFDVQMFTCVCFKRLSTIGTKQLSKQSFYIMQDWAARIIIFRWRSNHFFMNPINSLYLPSYKLQASRRHTTSFDVFIISIKIKLELNIYKYENQNQILCNTKYMEMYICAQWCRP